jgi:hypothetical protein
MTGIIDTTQTPEQYHAVKALSKSGIDELLRSPAHFRAWLDGRGQDKQTEALLFGSVFHCLALEPAAFTDRYFVRTCSGSTKEGREETKQAAERGLTLVPADMFRQATRMAQEVREHKLIARVLAGSPSIEASIYWNEEHAGASIPCKARIDLLGDVPGFGFVAVDLKSTTDASPVELSRSIFKWGYHRQAAWYRRALRSVGIDSSVFVLVAVEKDPPHIVTAANVADGAQAAALEELRFALRQYADCERTGVWPDYTDGAIIDLDLPDWAYRRNAA